MAKNVLHTFTPATAPKWDQPLSITSTAESTQLKELCKDMNTPPKTPAEALERIHKVVWEKHPTTGIPRAMMVFQRIEELALAGDTKAQKLYIERAFGKMPDDVRVSLSDWEGKTDEEIMHEFSLKGNDDAVYRLLKATEAHLTKQNKKSVKMRNSAKSSRVEVL